MGKQINEGTNKFKLKSKLTENVFICLQFWQFQSAPIDSEKEAGQTIRPVMTSFAEYHRQNL